MENKFPVITGISGQNGQKAGIGERSEYVKSEVNMIDDWRSFTEPPSEEVGTGGPLGTHP